MPGSIFGGFARRLPPNPQWLPQGPAELAQGLADVPAPPVASLQGPLGTGAGTSGVETPPRLTFLRHRRIAPAPAPGARMGRFVAVRHFRDLKTVVWASMSLRLHPGQLTASARGIVIGTDIDRAQIYIEP